MTSVSTLSFNNQTRVALSRLQRELNDVGTQVANNGRLNDVGKTLGRLTGSSVSARSVSDTLKEQQTSNGIVDRRLKTSEAAMTTISGGAQTVADSLTGVSVGKGWDVFVSDATSGLAQMTNALNSNDGGTYVFGGIQSEKKPVADYQNSPAKAAATASFDAFVLAATGTTDTSQVTKVQMEAYLGAGYTDSANVVHRYSDLFTDMNWKANWSSASSDKGQARISGTETVTAAGSANESAFRSVASGYTMLIDLDIAGLNEAARTVVLNSSQSMLRSGIGGITTLGAAVGTTRKRIETANTELQRQQDIMTNTVEALETEDISALGVRAKALQTNLDAAYALTARIQGLSILDYL